MIFIEYITRPIQRKPPNKKAKKLRRFGKGQEKGVTTMVEFETVKAEEVKFGKNNFIEVARKHAKSDQGENEFISVSRGFFLPDGTKRFKKSIAIPDEKEIKDFVAQKISEF